MRICHILRLTREKKNNAIIIGTAGNEYQINENMRLKVEDEKDFFRKKV